MQRNDIEQMTTMITRTNTPETCENSQNNNIDTSYKNKVSSNSSSVSKTHPTCFVIHTYLTWPLYLGAANIKLKCDLDIDHIWNRSLSSKPHSQYVSRVASFAKLMTAPIAPFVRRWLVLLEKTEMNLSRGEPTNSNLDNLCDYYHLRRRSDLARPN